MRLRGCDGAQRGRNRGPARDRRRHWLPPPSWLRGEGNIGYRTRGALLCSAAPQGVRGKFLARRRRDSMEKWLKGGDRSIASAADGKVRETVEYILDDVA